jgi:hypothetical protein
MGRYPTMLANPDRWLPWLIGAIPAGLQLIRRFQPAVIWSTFPIATAHIIGATLHRLTKLPWVADFRDPMAQEGYPPNPRIRRSFIDIEQRTVLEAAACCFTTPGALRTYRERYGDLAGQRFTVIENGYDESSFESVPLRGQGYAPLLPGKLTLVHSGIVYPSERDPTELFKALAIFKARHPEQAARLAVRFRAASNDDLLANLAARNSVSGMIETAGPLPYRDALTEMLSADGLLLLQASNCNDQIPAKFYEYLRARRPIFALTDARGDTGSAMIAHGLEVAAPLDDAMSIAAALHRFVSDPVWRATLIAAPRFVASASREARTEQLAALLNMLVRQQGGKVSDSRPESPC